MRTKQYYLAVIFICFLFFTAKSQVSGYMGKTVEISYTNQFFLSTQNMKNGDFPLFTINSFRLEKVVARHGSLVFSYNMFSSIVTIENYYFTYYDSSSGYQNYMEPSGNDKFFTVQSKVYGLQYKIYTNGWLAPIGSYFSFGASYLEGHSSDYLINISELNPKNTDFHRLYLTASYGKKWMLNNRISFHLGVNSALSLDLNSFPFSISFGNYSNNQEDVDKAFQDLVKKRMRRMMFMNLEFGFGILLF